MTTTIDNTQDVMDSRDIIERLQELRDEIEGIEGDDFDRSKVSGPDDPVEKELRDELVQLEKFADECSGSPDWEHGESVIRGTHFTDYIEELIKDCYPMPKELNSGDWPWRHMTVDYEAAAEEAKQDYICAEFDGVEYYIRA